ncbi:hypothetical protein ACQ4LE_001128 [Meloidogyne hapla]
MSGTIRQAMTPAITRLREHFEEIRPALDAQERTAEGMEMLRTRLVKVRRIVTRLEEKANQWQDYIRGLPANERQAEEQVLANFAPLERHYAAWIEDAHEIIADIEILLTNESEDGSTQSDISVELGVGQNRMNQSRRPEVHLNAQGTPINEGHIPVNEHLFRRNEYNIPAHLPRTRLAEFYGDPLVWPEFWQSFSRTVDSLEMDPGLKAHYLIQCLRGKAKRAVLGYRPIAEHYEPLKDALKRQFGNEKAIRDTLHAELISLPMANESVYSLRSYLEEVERICRSLTAMGRVEDESIVMMAIKNKLPKNIVLELLKKEKENRVNWNVEELRKGLEEIVTLREEAQRCVQTFSKNNHSQQRFGNNWSNNNRGFNQKRNNFKKENYERVFTVQSGDGRVRNAKKFEISCYFCHGAHHADKCEKVKAIYLRTKILSEQNRCLLCLRKGHAVSNCVNKFDCNICNGRHNKLICPKLYKNGKNEKEVKKFEQINQVETSENVLTIMEKPKEVVLMQSNMVLFNSNGNKRCNSVGLFDTGATINFITEEKVKELNLKKIGEKELGILPFSHKEPIKFNSAIFLVEILLNDGSKEEIIAYKVKREIMPNIKCANLENGKIRTLEKIPDILISIKHFWRFFRSLVPLSENLFQVETSVGKIICGELGSELNGILSIEENNIMPILNINSEEEKMNNFWSLETIGVKDDPTSKDDQVAMDFFKQTIKRSPNGRYIVKWPWKENKENLPSNFSLAYRRFLGLMERLKKNPDLMLEYEKIIESDIKRGVLEDADRNKGSIEHFLPHHPVITTKKVRIVYDASAKIRGGKSLNELLYRGPIIMPELAGMLIRFRLPEIAIWADIEKAFHCLELDPEDREVLKLIWLKDVRKPISSENIKYLRFSKVPFGVISSPFLLSATVRHHLESMDDPIAKMVKNNSYVDNILIGVDTKEEAYEAYIKLKSIFKTAQMNLREFISNNLEFNEDLPMEDRLDKSKPKILGIPWNIETDRISIAFPTVGSSVKVNKRLVLKQLASVFDPLGLASPSLLPAKLFFQSLWEKPREWDNILTEEEANKWLNITEKWKVSPIEIKRKIIGKIGDYQLHVFCDASKDAYASCVYMRCLINGKMSVNILYARNRLRPKKMSVSIPRMELLGVLIATRAIKFVENQIGLKISEKYLWCDSKPVLFWIKENYKGEKFVENRIKEIRSHEDLKFGYTPTECNPADIATRGCAPVELSTNYLWWTGPEWLTNDSWPVELNFVVENKEENNPEEKFNFEVNQINNKDCDNLIDFNKLNSWNKIIKIILFVSLFTRIWMNKCKKKVKSEFVESLSKNGKHTGVDFKKVEIFLLKVVQKGLDKNSLNKNVQIILDKNGILRLNTRIGKSEMPEGFKNPILLPKGHSAVKLIIEKIHVELLHSGVDAVLGNFLIKYWSPGARREAKKVVKNCKKCQKINGPKFALPLMPGLPKERLRKSRAFEAIGVDYLGPSLYKIENGKAKFWIALFTCLSTRAVHLEIALELSALEFMHCLRRFIAIRGCPKKIISDNATQFKVGSELVGAKFVGKWIEKSKNEEKRINNFLINKGIEWCFIPSLSPWAGGVYERLVKLVKDSFKRTLGGVILNLEELRTFIKEVEFSINCRPITFVSGEIDGPSCLRPIDFLLPNIEINENINSSDDEEEFKIGKLSMGDQLRVRLKATQKAFEKFWTRWTREYLLILRDKSKWAHNNDRTALRREPMVGEVVIVQQEGQPRNTWSLGKIVELDGSPPKSAKVQIGKRYLVRPINKLFSMEAEGDEYKKEKKESKKLENGQNIEENKNENKNKGQEQKSKNDLKQIKDGKNKLIKKIINQHIQWSPDRKRL